MSILLIGQGNRYYSSHKPAYMRKEEINQYSKQKRIQQELYKKDLLGQMKESYERKRREREREIELDKQYEKIFYEQLEERRCDRQYKASEDSGRKLLESPFSSPVIKRRKEFTMALPPIQNQFSSPSRQQRLYTQPIDKDFSNNKSRINTENTAESYKPTQQNYTLFEMESPQARQRKMHEELQTKLKEVYELMAQSAKHLEEAEQLQKIGSKLSLSPIRLGLEKGYKIKYPEYVSPSYYSSEQHKDYFKLPNISRSFKSPSLSQKESQDDWREWYSKEKLRQLQNRYRKELSLSPQDIRLSVRAKTPKFQKSLEE